MPGSSLPDGTVTRTELGLLTLSGPGGSGKTRLAVEAATELVPEFKAGVFWVGLSALRPPELLTRKNPLLCASNVVGETGRKRFASRRGAAGARGDRGARRGFVASRGCSVFRSRRLRQESPGGEDTQ
jgi:hypothetical protein